MNPQVFMLLNAALTAAQVVGNAQPVLAKIAELEAKGATFEQVLEAVRGMVLASEDAAKKATE